MNELLLTVGLILLQSVAFVVALLIRTPGSPD